MRRKEQEITERSEIDEIISKSRVFRLAMVDGDKPYIVPLCLGYDGKNIYFHCARDGKKIEILKENNNVCFEFEEVGDLEKSDKPCNWGIKYKSVIGNGKAIFIDDVEGKKKGLNLIMKQYIDEPYEFEDRMVAGVTVVRIDIEEIAGKRSS
jgi:nitroimidazol reductase NimA-like FMN-containing flavoprotein (pyridoxamine 5'-phosphate oxidase superfamily)